MLPGLVGLHVSRKLGGVARDASNVTSRCSTSPGVTTAMTAGGAFPLFEMNLKRAIETGRTYGPRLLIAGPISMATRRAIRCS
jgi:hypothetical protein